MLNRQLIKRMIEFATAHPERIELDFFATSKTDLESSSETLLHEAAEKGVYTVDTVMDLTGLACALSDFRMAQNPDLYSITNHAAQALNVSPDDGLINTDHWPEEFRRRVFNANPEPAGFVAVEYLKSLLARETEFYLERYDLADGDCVLDKDCRLIFAEKGRDKAIARIAYMAGEYSYEEDDAVNIADLILEDIRGGECAP